LRETQNAPPKVGQRALFSSEADTRQDNEDANLSKAHQNEISSDAQSRLGVTLRPFQALDIVRMRRQYGAGTSRLCYCLPTGAGKTICRRIRNQARQARTDPRSPARNLRSDINRAD
jgi:hypothetical protein